MNNFESKQSHSNLTTDEGWSVQIYDGKRRLLWVLEPSHAWMFLIGCSFGVLLSIVWFNAVRLNPNIEPISPSHPPAWQVD